MLQNHAAERTKTSSVTVTIQIVAPAHTVQLSAPLLLMETSLQLLALRGCGSRRGSDLVDGSQSAVTAIDVSPLDAGLLDAVVRLVRLLQAPTDARVLAPLVTREIVYRLFMGAQGGRLQYVAALGGPNHRIAAAIERLRHDFDQPLYIEELARELGMSVSGFHHHFRALTAMSPLQFQKQLRLQEARRLMFGEGLDAASAGYRVGYGNASHFTREYKRLFGAPPMHDVQQLREGAGNSALQEAARGL
jgi:AraC-like DNA-binding protein